MNIKKELMLIILRNFFSNNKKIMNIILKNYYEIDTCPVNLAIVFLLFFAL